MIRRLQRTKHWTPAMIEASPTEFRRLFPTTLKAVTRLATYAGKRLAERLAQAGTTVKTFHEDIPVAQTIARELGLSGSNGRKEVERWRAAYGVPKNRTNMMLMVAWSTLRYPKKRVVVERKKQVPLGAENNPSVTAREMISTYGFRAEKMARKLRKGLKQTERYWDKVLAELRKIRAQAKAARLPEKNMERRGYGILSGYMRRQQKSLRNGNAVHVAGTSYAVPVANRVLSHKETYAQTLCLARDDMFKARCNRPVPLGGTIFCSICEPKKERL